MSAYDLVIGLEVHVQLNTKAKLFSPEAAHFVSEANVHIDPVSLAHPGTLPVLNEAALEKAVALGSALGCSITRNSRFARKHYFYPDLPKAYQISQYDDPICVGGEVPVLRSDGTTFSVALTRIHMEEDAGKSVHDLDPTHTLLDYNRCGVPLVEMVTEPVLRSASDAARFVAEIRRIVRYLGVSDGNMEEGSLRCDANISIRPTGTTPLGTKTEIKNMNSFRHIEQAITYEAARQQACLERGEAVVQETRLWDVASGVTRSMRSKEDAHDYRYFPDPDLPPMIVSDELLASVAATLPELPRQRYARYVTDWGISPTDAETLVEERHRADLFEGVVSRMDPPAIKLVCGTMLTHVLRLEESGSASAPLSVEALLGVCMLRQSDRIASASVAPLIERLATAAAGTSAEAAAEALGVLITATEGDDTLSQLVAEVLSRHTAEVARYRDGEQQLIGFFIGQVMRAYDGAANPKHVRTLLIEQLG